MGFAGQIKSWSITNALKWGVRWPLRRPSWQMWQTHKERDPFFAIKIHFSLSHCFFVLRIDRFCLFPSQKSLHKWTSLSPVFYLRICLFTFQTLVQKGTLLIRMCFLFSNSAFVVQNSGTYLPPITRATCFWKTIYFF